MLVDVLADNICTSLAMEHELLLPRFSYVVSVCLHGSTLRKAEGAPYIKWTVGLCFLPFRGSKDRKSVEKNSLVENFAIFIFHGGK